MVTGHYLSSIKAKPVQIFEFMSLETKEQDKLTHILLLQRKPEEESAEADTKKTKQEEGSGDTEKNGTANDKSESAMVNQTPSYHYK